MDHGDCGNLRRQRTFNWFIFSLYICSLHESITHLYPHFQQRSSIHLDTLPSLMNYNFTIYFDFILNWIHSYIHVPNWSYFATGLSIIWLNFTNPAFIFYFAQLTDWLLMAIFKLLSLDNNSTPFNNWTRQTKESNQIQSNELTELKPQTTNCPIQWIVFIAKSEFRLRLLTQINRKCQSECDAIKRTTGNTEHIFNANWSQFPIQIHFFLFKITIAFEYKRTSSAS